MSGPRPATRRWLPTPCPSTPNAPAAMHRAWRRSTASIETSHLFAERAIEQRHCADLRLLLNSGPGAGERYIAAGVPWFSMPLRPRLDHHQPAAAVRPAADRAADAGDPGAPPGDRDVDEWRDAQPGKILHELRTGELARAGEIPHTPYYGTVDATPLWLMLLDEYERWTADDELVDRLWPNALAALDWIDEYGDIDGDGFVEYERTVASAAWSTRAGRTPATRSASATARSPRRRSRWSRCRATSTRRRRGMARLARLRGDDELADAPGGARPTSCAALRGARSGWRTWAPTPWRSTATRRPVDGIASNAGHALWAGIAIAGARGAASARVAARRRHVERLGHPHAVEPTRSATTRSATTSAASGRTTTRICAAGFARYGLTDEARKVAGALLEATTALPRSAAAGAVLWLRPRLVAAARALPGRLLAAGVGRRRALPHDQRHARHAAPTRANSAWSMVAPGLPAWLADLRLRNLRVGDALVDLVFGRAGGVGLGRGPAPDRRPGRRRPALNRLG